MDGFPSYQQRTNTTWLRLLFLSTGFVIGGMCLWAFLQKRSDNEREALATVPPATQAAPHADTTNVLQVTEQTSGNPWQVESPARAAIESAKPLASTPRASIHSATWRAARQASFEVEESRAVHVSKPPLDQHDTFIPLPDFSPLATESSTPVSQSRGQSHEQDTTRQIPSASEPPSPAPQEPPAATAPSHADSIITHANDSFWLIAQRVYEDPRYYAALFEHNRNWIAYPDQIEQGFRVMTPSIGQLRKQYPELCPE